MWCDESRDEGLRGLRHFLEYLEAVGKMTVVSLADFVDVVKAYYLEGVPTP